MVSGQFDLEKGTHFAQEVWNRKGMESFAMNLRTEKVFSKFFPKILLSVTTELRRFQNGKLVKHGLCCNHGVLDLLAFLH